ncbi:hypothetical protein ACFL38_00105 [Candidatus Omnitrophota bacterium]
MVGLLIAVAIVCLLIYAAVTTYVNPSVPESEMKALGIEQDKGVSAYKAVLDTSKEKIGAINKQALERNKELDTLLE